MISKVQPFELLVDYVTNHAQKGLTIPHAYYVDSMRKAYNMGVKSIEKAKFIADNTDVQALSKKDYTEWEDVFNKITDAQAYLSIIPSPVINKPKKTKATP